MVLQVIESAAVQSETPPVHPVITLLSDFCHTKNTASRGFTRVVFSLNHYYLFRYQSCNCLYVTS